MSTTYRYDGDHFYRATCDTCGPIGDRYTVPGAAANVARFHECGNLCPHCHLRKTGTGMRGLCYVCYHDPEIRLDYPRSFWTADELLEEWDELRRQGYTLHAAADRLGVTYAALDKALCRAKKKGDPRAIRQGVRTVAAA